MADEGAKARRALEMFGDQLETLRNDYKERIALIFEGVIPFDNPQKMQHEIERLGAKLAVFNDFINDLGRAIASDELAKADEEATE